MSPQHRQMDDTAEFAVARHCPTRPAEACTELGHAHHPTPRRPWWQRLARWWRLGHLKAELAGLQADEQALLQDLRLDEALALAHPARLHSPAVQELRSATLHHLDDVRQQIDRKVAALQAAGVRP